MRAIVDLEDDTMAERTSRQIVLHGCGKFPDIGVDPEQLLAEARKRGKRPMSTTSAADDNSPSHLTYKLRAWVLILQSQVAVAEAARAIHEAVKADEDLVAAIDAAYRVGGAVAVRDLVLRGLVTSKS